MNLKITAGFLKSRPLKCPDQVARPTKSIVRESFFNSLQSFIQNSSFLDLFSGSGIMGLEAISRGADHATFIDQSSLAIRTIRENIKSLGIEDQTTLYLSDVNKKLKNLKGSFSIIYLDPPYDLDTKYLIKTLSLLSSPLQKDGFIFLERRAKEEPLQIDRLTYIKTKTFGSSCVHEYTQ